MEQTEEIFATATIRLRTSAAAADSREEAVDAAAVRVETVDAAVRRHLQSPQYAVLVRQAQLAQPDLRERGLPF